MGLVQFNDPIVNKKIEYNIPNNLEDKWKVLSKKVIKENNDRVYVVVGLEGSGKSSFTFQQAKFIDPTFSLERICFTGEQFLEQIQSAPPGSVVVFDEAFRGFSSKASQSKVNKILVQAMMEVRRRNLIIFIIIPSLILLEHYIAVHRSNALFQIYKRRIADKADGRMTWNFKVYNRNKAAEIYHKAKKNYGRFPKVFTSQRGRFFLRKFEVNERKRNLPYETFDEEAYDNKKGVAFGDKRSQDELDPIKIELNTLKFKISQINPKKLNPLTKKAFAEALGYEDSTLRKWKTLENTLKT